MADIFEGIVKKESNIIPTYLSVGREITEVAVGVMVRSDGSYLLAQRMQGKPYQGYWEFPGGKLEVDTALFMQGNELGRGTV